MSILPVRSTTTLWNHLMVNAPEALAMLPTTATGVVDWQDIWVAHLDTGFSYHPVFNWSGNTSDIILYQRGLNHIEIGETPHDPQGYSGNPGHGTRTSSVLAGNLAGSYIGIAPGVPTVPYRVSNTVILSEREIRANLANAIRHAIDFNGCDVITISMGTPMLIPFTSRPLGEAVDYAYERGVIVVGAGGQVIDQVVYPAKFFRAIGVGGVNEDREIWFAYEVLDGGESGNQHEFIDVWAPADDVLRANTFN